MADPRHPLRRLFPEHLGKAPYLWLVYLAFVPVGLLAERTSPAIWALQIAGIVVFLPIFVASFRICGTPKLWTSAAMLLLGAVLIPTDPGAMTYFIYGAAVIGFAVDTKPALIALGIFCAIVAVDVFATHIQPYPAFLALLLSSVVGAANIGQGQAARANAALRRAHEDIERLAKMAERERIARDLHDVLGHTLSVISLKSQLAVRLSDRDPARAAAEIAEVEEIARTALSELRETVSGYRSAGLPAEVDRARFVLASAGVAVECEVADVALGAIEENVLALALREAVTNVVRHARAGMCRVSIAAAERSCVLEIADDGARPSGAEGAGLRGMRERVEAVGGTFARDLTAGTLLRISVPLAHDRA